MKYRPLDEKRNEIRVVSFVYDTDHAPSLPPTKRAALPLRCVVKHVSLNSTNIATSQRTRDGSAHQALSDPIFNRDTDIENRLQAFAQQFARGNGHSSRIGLSELETRVATTAGFLRRYSWGDFEALSYVWGNKKPSHEIIVNGVLTKVRKNLASALLALRELPEARKGMCFWVDSLCIDQDNEEERASQVKKMQHIYQKARSVVVWLGEPRPSSDKAVFLLFQVFGWVSYLRNHQWYANSWYTFLPLSMNPEYAEAFMELLSNPYWQRLWIIQELAMNHQSTLFIYGSHFLSRVILREALVCLRELPEDTVTFGKPTIQHQRKFHSLTSRIVKLLSLEPGSDGYGIDHLLVLVSRAQATNPRDKIYGILGLLPIDLASRINPDYSIPVKMLYKLFAEAIASSTRQLDLLLCWKTERVDTKWPPSWVPDWRYDHDRKHIRFLRNPRTTDTNSKAFYFKTVSGILCCEGTEVGRVEDCSQAFPIVSEARTLAEEESRFDSWASQTPANKVREAVSQTILLGHPGGARVPSALDVPWEILPAKHSVVDQHEVSDLSSLQDDMYLEEFNKFRIANRSFQLFGQPFESFFPRSGTLRKNFWTGLYLATRSLHGRRIITTTTGLIGLAPKSVQAGDVVVKILACSFPVVLRRQGLNFKVIGECYVHGVTEKEGFCLRKSEVFRIR